MKTFSFQRNFRRFFVTLSLFFLNFRRKKKKTPQRKRQNERRGKRYPRHCSTDNWINRKLPSPQTDRFEPFFTSCRAWTNFSLGNSEVSKVCDDPLTDEMWRFQQRGAANRIIEGLKNDWRWNWLDREYDGCRIGDVIRKVEVRGKAFCVAYMYEDIEVRQSWVRGTSGTPWHKVPQAELPCIVHLLDWMKLLKIAWFLPWINWTEDMKVRIY